MFAKLDGVESRYREINAQLQDTEITSDPKRVRNLMKELTEIQPVVVAYQEYKKSKEEIASNVQLLAEEKDDEIRQMAKEEINALEKRVAELAAQLKVLLLPKDPNDDKNILLEIRAGAGGDEASLFAQELFRAYSLFAAGKGWKVDLMSASPGNVGGYKEVVASITGEKVFSILKYESGVHRVQRVPKTEAQGRVHTSTVTVAVLPEAEEVDIKVNPNDVRIETFRAGGAGGQSVNRTDSAVRLIHIPTNTVVVCQDEKSQLTNKEKAFRILYTRLLDVEHEKARKEESEKRLAQIGSGDRSERIRTYNFPQSRITDHRIGLTIHQIGEVMNGNFSPILEPVMAYYQTEALKRQDS